MHAIASKDAFVTILVRGIETCNPLRLCGASAANHEVGARNAIESVFKEAFPTSRRGRQKWRSEAHFFIFFFEGLGCCLNPKESPN